MLKEGFSNLVYFHNRFIEMLVARSNSQMSEELRRITLLVKILVYGSFFCLLMTLVRMRGDAVAPEALISSALVSGVGSVLLLSVLIFFVVTGRHRAAADLSIVAVLFLILFMAYTDGGLHSRVMAWLSALPLMANFIGVRLRSVQTCLVATFGLVLVFAAQTFGIVDNPLPEDPLFGRMMAGVTSMFFVSAVSQAYEGARQAAEGHILAASEKAQELARLKSDFLANMSHEIRNPLNALIGMLRLLKRSELNDSQAERAEIAYSNAQSLLGLLNDILDLSKMDAGKLRLETVEFDLRCMLGELVETMAVGAQEKGLELILDLTAISDSIVVGDPVRIKQIFTNLLGNAIKFTQQGEIVVRVSLERVASNSEARDGEEGHHQGHALYRLKGSVEDSGVGVPLAAQESLFEPFVQGDTSITRTHGGTGLGLTICKKICRAMDGEISVISGEGGGSLFNFEIEVKRSLSSMSTSECSDPCLNGTRILVVDDNQSCSELLAKQLTIWGAKVTLASSALSGLEEIQKNVLSPFSILLVDFEMPEVNGISFGETLSKQYPDNDCKMVLMTLLISEFDSGLPAEVGFDLCVAKPITISDLQNFVA